MQSQPVMFVTCMFDQLIRSMRGDHNVMKAECVTMISGVISRRITDRGGMM